MAMTGSTGPRIRGDRVGVGGRRRIAVLLEPGRSGVATLQRAVALAAEHEAELTVVAVAPQAERPRCAGPSPQCFNDAVHDAVAGELEAAAQRLGPSRAAANYVLLVQGQDQSLGEWLQAGSFDLVMLPGRRPMLRWPRHPEARRLRRRLDAEVRVVAP
jgi:hypothetical protein